TSLDDFVARVDPRLLNKRQIECLAAAGAFDCFEDWTRSDIFGLADVMLATAGSLAEARSSGQKNLFGGEGPAATGINLAVHAKRSDGWNLAQTMVQEKDAFGF